MNIFLPINLNMCFGCSKEPSHGDDSFEYPLHMFWLKNKKFIFNYTPLSEVCNSLYTNDFSLWFSTLGLRWLNVHVKGSEVRISKLRQGTKIFQYCTCPAGWVTYSFHLSCKHMHLSFKSVCNIEH